MTSSKSLLPAIYFAGMKKTNSAWNVAAGSYMPCQSMSFRVSRFEACQVCILRRNPRRPQYSFYARLRAVAARSPTRYRTHADECKRHRCRDKRVTTGLVALTEAKVEKNFRHGNRDAAESRQRACTTRSRKERCRLYRNHVLRNEREDPHC